MVEETWEFKLASWDSRLEIWVMRESRYFISLVDSFESSVDGAEGGDCWDAIVVYIMMPVALAYTRGSCGMGVLCWNCYRLISASDILGLQFYSRLSTFDFTGDIN